VGPEIYWEMQVNITDATWEICKVLWKQQGTWCGLEVKEGFLKDMTFKLRQKEATTTTTTNRAVSQIKVK
jgi:hypothetical protein